MSSEWYTPPRCTHCRRVMFWSRRRSKWLCPQYGTRAKDLIVRSEHSIVPKAPK